MLIIRNKKDFLAGVMFTLIGAGFAWIGREYDFGAAHQMGPGYFPIILSLVLVGIGIIIMVGGLFTVDEPPRDFALKGLLLVVVSTMLFAFLVRGAGLALATFILVCTSAVGSQRFRWKPTVVLAIGLSVFCVMVFVYGLGLPLPAIGPWLAY